MGRLALEIIFIKERGFELDGFSAEQIDIILTNMCTSCTISIIIVILITGYVLCISNSNSKLASPDRISSDSDCLFPDVHFCV